jgi:hypothetical protein
MAAPEDGRDWRADPRRGDMIVPRFGHFRVARVIIRVNATHVETSGMAGGMRNSWMKRERLARYDYVGSDR